MSRIITVISGKGGTGKTTTTSNLSAAMFNYGRSVIAVDGNLTTPNLSLHLGIPFYPITLHDVIKGRAQITEAIYVHHSGIRVIPASLSIEHLKDLNADKIHRALMSLMPSGDMIVIDGAAGLGRETRSAVKIADEVLVVTNPELPSVTDALKAIKISESLNVPIAGVVLNKVKGERHELTKKEIEDILEKKIIGIIPEDVAVPQSIAMKTPVVHFAPNSKAAKAYNRLAANILKETYVEEKESFWSRFLQIFK